MLLFGSLRASCLALVGVLLLIPGEPARAGKVGPPRLVEALRAQPGEIYDYVVSFEEDETPDSGLAGQRETLPLKLLNGFAMRMPVADAFELADQPGIRWVWYLHPDEATGTIRVLQGLDYTVATLPLPNLANLSLGPPTKFYRTEPELDAPVQRALGAAAERGLIAIVAIGNTGEQAPGYVNPWSAPPWVISVGAWDHTTNAVWTGSSTAEPDRVDAWPDVVAPGVDVIGPWTSTREKSVERRAYDEANDRFRTQIPKEEQDKYTLMTGTSQAAAVVSGAAAQILRYLNGFIVEHKTSFGDALFELEAGPDRMSDYDRQAPRLTGTATPNGSGGMTYSYTLDEPWRLVKQILIDTAIPVPGARSWQAGAGLVDRDYINAQFGAYGSEPPQLLPVKVQ